MSELWVDTQGDLWIEGADGLMHTPETAAFPREHVEKKWGPLKPAAAGLVSAVSSRQQVAEQIASAIEVRQRAAGRAVAHEALALAAKIAREIGAMP